MLFFIIYTLIMTCLFCYFRSQKNYKVSVITKTLASMGFVSFAIFIPAIKNSFTLTNSLLIFGTVWGLIGDIILDFYRSLNNKHYLAIGFVSFAIGHLAYISTIVCFAKDIRASLNFSNIMYALFLAIIITSITMLICKIMKFDFKNFFVTSTLYAFILFFTTILSWIVVFKNISYLCLGIGFTLFIISDCILSAIYFGGKKESNLYQILNHLTYYSAQILICCAIFSI